MTEQDIGTSVDNNWRRVQEELGVRFKNRHLLIIHYPKTEQKTVVIVRPSTRIKEVIAIACDQLGLEESENFALIMNDQVFDKKATVEETNIHEPTRGLLQLELERNIIIHEHITQFDERARKLIKKMTLSEMITNAESNTIKKLMQKYNILLCGPSGVGKSTLINALCQEDLAATSPRLDSCTQQVTCYTFKKESHVRGGEYEVNFYDTPGIENWTQEAVENYLSGIIKDTNPLCMIFCTKCNTLCPTRVLEWVVNECVEADVFCALVCTNMYAGVGADSIIEELKTVLSRCLSAEEIKTDADNITYFGQKALCTKVNSINYQQVIKNRAGSVIHTINMPPEGLDELIKGILTSISDQKLTGWLKTVLKRVKGWEWVKLKGRNFFEWLGLK